MNAALCTEGSLGLHRQKPALDDDLKQALLQLAEAITSCPVREVRVQYHFPVVFMTDGAFEEVKGDTAASIGGVVLDPFSKEAWWYAMSLAPDVVEILLKSSQNPIITIELVGVLVGMVLFSHVLQGRSFIGFVDNEPGKHGIIRGTSSNPEASNVIEGICHAEIDAKALGFWERIPSQSNLADGPSRGRGPETIEGWPRPRRVEARAVHDARLRPRGRDAARDGQAPPCDPLRASVASGLTLFFCGGGTSRLPDRLW